MTDDRKDDVGLTISATSTSLTVSVRSRFLRAWDHLFGAKADLKGLAAEREILLARARQVQEVKILDELGDIAVERLRSDPSLAEALIDSHFIGAMREQVNMAASFGKAEEQAVLLPPPSKPAAADSQGDEIDEDFLNFWGHFAKNASSERMRTFLGRILAGEIQQPGSFSHSTLRVAAELDARTATLFRDEVNLRVETSLVRELSPLDVKKYISLEDAGLISGVGTALTQSFVTTVPGKVQFIFGPNRLTMDLKQVEATRFKVPVYVITKVGMELAAILPQDHEQAPRLFARASDGEVSSAKLWRKVEDRWVLIEILKQSDQPAEAANS